jgi:hypothetical protein
VLRARLASGWNGAPDHSGDGLPAGSEVGEDQVTRIGCIFVKAHATDMDPDLLALRLAATAQPDLHQVLLPPLRFPDSFLRLPVRLSGPHVLVLPDHRVITAWPAGSPVDPNRPERAPWEQAARLLARLHAARPPADLPTTLGPARVARAIRRLRASGSEHDAVRDVLRAYATLPAWATGDTRDGPSRQPVLVHGDWHLGQLVVVDAKWLLIDLDTMGLGDPAWDLARPAAWFAAGIISAEIFQRVLRSYRAAGGVAVPEPDPWSVLETPARALVVQSAATAIAKAAGGGYELDDVDLTMISCCRQIAGLEPY